MNFPRIVIAAALCGLSLSVNASNLITNGSFEAGTPIANVGDPASQQLFGGDSLALAGWTVTGSDIAWIGTGNAYGIVASDGVNFLDLTGWHSTGTGAGVTQTIATVAGTSYTLSFDIGNSVNYNYGSNDSLLVSAGDLSQIVGTTQNASASSWDHVSLSFIAQGSSTDVAFTGQDAVWYIGLDNVEVTAAVPEPQAYAMLLGGLALAGLMARRRRASGAV